MLLMVSTRRFALLLVAQAACVLLLLLLHAPCFLSSCYLLLWTLLRASHLPPACSTDIRLVWFERPGIAPHD